ncbi:MAG TPA: DUF2272 domain-containing protein [Acetobacteraceae bacterium]|nr:DUF2272 domain-containing protein [Acetobacteraceae bacterium]
MLRPVILALGLLAVAGCAAKPAHPGVIARAPYGQGRASIPDDHVPAFAQVPYEPFARQEAVAIALREWRLFGQPVDDRAPQDVPPPLPDQKPERWPGLWERVGEYWWTAMWPGMKEARWTGKHNAEGEVFPASEDGNYAWSAAFISYVMRIAGAGARFPYSINHAGYINAALQGGYALRDRRPADYAPKPGDLICWGMRHNVPLTFNDLPTDRPFPGHCDIVVAARPGQLSVVGGNVDDAVTMKHIPTTAEGRLADASGTVLDTRYAWFVVVQVLYDVNALPDSDAPPAAPAS